MKSRLLACAFLASAALSASLAAPAFANMCRTDSGRTCATGMPVEGYCMCGNDGGTVVTGGPAHPRHMPAPVPPHQ